jgi:hypothetical protein
MISGHDNTPALNIPFPSYNQTEPHVFRSKSRTVRWFPKRKLRQLRSQAIQTANTIAQSYGYSDIASAEQQYPAIERLRNSIKASRLSIGAKGKSGAEVGSRLNI